jgi:ubiquinone/menaquinone biosynthesis C-methylase UbiE
MTRSCASSTISPLVSHRPYVCPWWLGWTLLFPARRWFLDPERLLAPLVRPGYSVLEVGPGTGFATMQLAECVGRDGRVWCVDLQPRMLTALDRRLRRKGLATRVTARCCQADDLGVADLADSIDLAVLIYVLHEVPDPATTIAQVAATLRANGQLLLVEPSSHCPSTLFAEQLRCAREVGFVPARQQPEYCTRLRQAVVLERNGCAFAVDAVSGRPVR